MKLLEKENMLNFVETKIGVIKNFHKEKSGAQELIEVYDDMVKNGTSTFELKFLVEDIELFFESI